MVLEDGEITDTYAYNPSYEWPGDEDEDGHELEILPEKRAARPICRFVVSKTAVLPARHKVAAADGFPEIQFGRDTQIGTTPRVRLKEMQVSKLHATVYWDSGQKQWNIVDMASVHGTFLSSPTAPSSSTDVRPKRLSGPRSSSRPTRLRHLDSLTIGSTTFLVHIHDSMIPCGDCTFSDGNEISLFPSKTTTSGSEQGFRESKNTTKLPVKGHRSALNDLKRTLLPRHAQHVSSSITSEYSDRSARRRALYTATRSDAPGVSLAPAPAAPAVSVPSIREPPPPPPVAITDDTPVSSSSFGHRMLLMQGWAPGTTLGVTNGTDGDRLALLEPLKSRSTVNRAGLGMRQGRTG